MQAVPASIGRYRILGLLGTGAMGVVYRGRDERLDREVAVKVMAADSTDPAGRARFQREARAAARLQHPNIVVIYELGEHQGAPFMAMELLHGHDVLQAMREERVSPAAAVSILAQLLDGLGHAHARGIVHRDLKPSNLFLVDQQRVKILDFGIARLGEGLTATGHVVGTPNYMSPEQVRGEPVDGRSDLFSAGLILYELLTRKKAYYADSISTLLYRIAHEPPDLDGMPAGPRWSSMRRVLEQALARERDRRYPDAASMAADLETALQDLERAGGDAAAVDLMPTVQIPAYDFERPLTPPAAPPLALPLTAPLAAPVTRPAAAPVGVAAPARAAWPAWWLAVGAAVLVTIVFGGLSGRALWRRWARASDRHPPSAAMAPERPAGAAAVPVVASSGSTLEPPTAGVPAASTPKAPIGPPPVTMVSARVENAKVGASPRPSPAAAVPAAVPAATPGPPAAPISPQLRLERANAQYEAGHYASALAEVHAVLKVAPGNAEADALRQDIEADMAALDYLKAAKHALAQQDTQAARQAVEEGLKKKPNDARLMALLRQLGP